MRKNSGEFESSHFLLYWHHPVLSVKSVLLDDYSCGCLTSFCLDLLLVIADILSDRVPGAVYGRFELSVLQTNKQKPQRQKRNKHQGDKPRTWQGRQQQLF